MYNSFARVYDKFMTDTPYDDWMELIKRIWAENGFNPAGRLILELGCGTGNMTMRLCKQGCDVIGVDSSADMLAIAASKVPDILFLCQDMRSLELYGTVDSVICVCDGINYLLKPSDVIKTLGLVKNYLNPGGVFIFDINTKYKYEKVLAENSFTSLDSDSAYIWENLYDKKARLNEYSVCFFIKEKNGLYSRFEEKHYQRAYSTGLIKRMLEKSGLTPLEIYDASYGRMSPHSERLFFVARNGEIYNS